MASKVKAARSLFDSFCDLLTACGNVDGERMRDAVDGAGELLAPGVEAVSEGDVVGGIAKVVVAHRKRAAFDGSPGGFNRERASSEVWAFIERQTSRSTVERVVASMSDAAVIALCKSRDSKLANAGAREARRTVLEWWDRDHPAAAAPPKLTKPF